ncbi:response regulator transcription factor [uncultured Psychrobacillus sp.]|uniref:response regulator transcription factor n=1 Tax=uncultured Psychrobacillus sp. TaxID=1551585 RepID=UPI00263779CC|nr:response regulator transcription factor [uncultured Psychrobacillus sp.]
MSKRILLVEDDESISEIVEKYLRSEGFMITTVNNGEAAVKQNQSSASVFDLIILDIMMPKLDGLEVLRIIRETSAVPILIMSAKDSDVDKALGLGLGADDYLAKPFSLLELSARVKAAIRRATQYSREQQLNEDVIEIGDLKVDVTNFMVMKGKEHIKLTAKEFAILKLIASNQNRVFTKQQIYQLVWEDEYYGDENIINVHMRRLREKIEEEPSNPRYIKTLWGIGYKLEGF